MTTNEILSRRVEKVLPTRESLARLISKRKIRLYQGFDPTGSRLHLGHSIGLRKLMDFAQAGHEVIVLFGTGTVLAGDPSQRDQARERIAAEQIKHNIAGWKDQVAKIIDFNKVNIMYNGEWLLKLTLPEIIEIASHISAVQLFKRDMFQKRLASGDTVWMHEVLYPLMQGYDSVAMDVDLEIGGTDQEFNMLIGRELLRKMKNKEKHVLTTPMIMGTDGKQMSKTSGNCVWLDDTPTDMFAKLMAVLDDQIVPYMELTTSLPLQQIKEVEGELTSGRTHPMEAKKTLAVAVVTDFHGARAAKDVQDEFEEVFQKGGLPEDVKTYNVKSKTVNLIEVLTETQMVTSRSQVRRLLEQGGVEWNGEKVTTPEIEIGAGGTLKVGKYRFLRIQQTTKAP